MKVSVVAPLKVVGLTNLSRPFMPPGLKIQLSFIRNEPQFYLTTATEGYNPTFVIQDMFVKAR